jgi:hypothetical protein
MEPSHRPDSRDWAVRIIPLFTVAVLQALGPASATSSTPPRDAHQELGATQIGPWRVRAWNAPTGGFSGCTAHRLDDGVVASFGRSSSGYSLALGSPQWQLEEQGPVAVTLVAGSASAQAEAFVTRRTNLLVMLQRNPALVPRIVNEFKRADAIEIRGAGVTVRVPSSEAAAALAELDRCWREHGGAATGSLGGSGP